MKNLLIKTGHPQGFLAYRYAIGSVALLLYLLGWVGLLSLGAYMLKHQWREALPFTIELKEGLSESQIFQYQQKMEGYDFVKYGSVRYVSNEEGIKTLQSELGRDSLLIFGENPLPDMLQFQLNGDYFAQAPAIVIDIKSHPEVALVFYDQHLIETATVMGYWSWALLLLAFLAVAAAFAFIRHALQLVLFANRSAIQVMQIAGADAKTLRYPYLRQSWINGLWSGGLALVALLFTAIAIQSLLGDGLSWWAWWQFWFVLFFIPILSVGLWAFATRRSVGKLLDY